MGHYYSGWRVLTPAYSAQQSDYGEPGSSGDFNLASFTVSVDAGLVGSDGDVNRCLRL